MAEVPGVWVATALVNIERRGRVAMVELNRPEVRNAINAEITHELNVLFDELDADDEVWAVVITGAGEKAFCAGADLKAMPSGDRRSGTGRRDTGFAGVVQRAFAKPLIAALNGAAMGGGLEIVLACDLVVAEDHAMLGLPEVKRGIVAAAGGIVRLSRRIPLAVAMEIGMTGEPITADRAAALGLVNVVVPKGTGRQRAVELAETITENAPLAVRLTKRMLRTAVSLHEDRLWALQAEGTHVVMASEDAREGPRAFIEKRPPRWIGG